MNKKPISTKIENCHSRNTVENASTNEKSIEVIVTSYGGITNLDDEIKEHSRTSPDVQLKNFH